MSFDRVTPQEQEPCLRMIDGLLQLAASDGAVPPADRLRLYMALLGLGLVALFAMVLLTVIRRVTNPRVSKPRSAGRRESPWEAAGKRARPEGGDGFLPAVGSDGGPSGKGGDHRHRGHDHHHDQQPGDIDGGGGGDAGGGGGGGGGGDGGGGGGGD